MQYLQSGFYPVYAPRELFVNWRGKLSPCLWTEVSGKHKTVSLRSLAKEYGISHEAVRRAPKAISFALELVGVAIFI